MKLAARRSIVAITLAAALTAPVHAQTYRFLSYDMERTVEMRGTVESFNWMNPNSELHVLVTNTATGKPEKWTFVMGPPSKSAQYGWDKESVKPGDSITLLMHPPRKDSNEHSGQLVRITLPDGRTLQATEPNPAG